MSFLDSKESKQFKEYCKNNFESSDYKRFYTLYAKTKFQIIQEECIIKKLNPKYVNKAYGNYNSDCIIVLQEKNISYTELLDKIFKSLFDTSISELCILFYKKSDIDFDIIVDNTNSTDVYNSLLKSELTFYNPKTILNFSSNLIDTNFKNSKVYNFGTDYMYLLYTYENSSFLDDEESQYLNDLKNELKKAFE